MNPATGNFLTMDTYEGSIYDPDTLHKYLYANGNPVTYSDPSGNFASAVGGLVATTINTVMNNFQTLNAMGIISGLTNSAITAFLGGSDMEIGEAFFKGYVTGFGLGAVLYVAAAYDVIVFAKMYLMISASNVSMSIVMTIASVIEKKERETLVYGTLAILSLLTLADAYNFACKVNIIGNKGNATIYYDKSTNSIKKANETANKYKVPNPDGKKGGDAHQTVIKGIKPSEEGGSIAYEVRYNTPGGQKNYRYADVVELDADGKVVRIYQVGKVNKNGTPVIREVRAIEDIMKSIDYNGEEIYFIPYNDDVEPIIYK